LALKKKQYAPSQGYSDWTIKEYLRECPNIVRWNAPLAIDWMLQISNRITSFNDLEQYNKAVDIINSYLDELETYRYYNKEAVWGKRFPERLPYIL